jgi:response regulator RpfG family c-di-GMP phosphodiesterase
MNDLTRENTWPAGFEQAPVVLLVDDEENILNALRRLLRPRGYQVLVATSGEAALEQFETNGIDLIISDMRMPGMQGSQLLGLVKQRSPETQRVLLTGYSDINSAITAINEGGIFRYVSKPWDDRDLLTVVQQALELRGLQKEKLRLEALTQAQNVELLDLNANLENKVQERTGELQTAHQELTLALEKLKKTFFTTVQVLSNLLELRAPALAGHGRRVADVSRRIAERMELPAEHINDILLAGLLHDIGKIGYPDTLLGKPTNKMTGEELGLARKHPLNGAAALLSLPDMRGVADIIRSHHERWDGEGYPEGLSGERIPLGARILALANDFDGAQLGTTTGRRLNIDEAKRYVLEGRSFRYDPAVADAFGELIGRLPRKPAEEKRIDGARLEAGMVLSRDLFSPDGVLLLATEYVLDEALIKQIRGYEQAFGRSLIICVKAP